jgi:hypothetical protein
MKNINILTITFLLGLLTSNFAFAKTCTESDIRAALSKGKAFIYKQEGCTNTDGVITIKKGIAVGKSGWIFDGGDLAKLLWKGAGSCDKKSRTSEYAFFGVDASNVTLKNFTAHGAPEGIHISTGNNNTIDNATFTEICEKAIRNGNKASNAAKNTLVINSKFYVNKGPADHVILVQGGSIRVESSYFKGKTNSIAACAENPDPGDHGKVPCKVPSKITAIGNTVDGCSGYGMRSAGKGPARGGYLIAEGNTFRNCHTPLQVEEEGHVEARGNTFNSCSQALKTTTSQATGVYGCGNKSSCKETSGSGISRETNCNL